MRAHSHSSLRSNASYQEIHSSYSLISTILRELIAANTSSTATPPPPLPLRLCPRNPFNLPHTNATPRILHLLTTLLDDSQRRRLGPHSGQNLLPPLPHAAGPIRMYEELLWRKEITARRAHVRVHRHILRVDELREMVEMPSRRRTGNVCVAFDLVGWWVEAWACRCCRDGRGLRVQGMCRLGPVVTHRCLLRLSIVSKG